MMNSNIWGTKREYLNRNRSSYEYNKIIEAKNICDEIVHSSNNTMEGFVRRLNEYHLADELLKYVFHVASCGTFIKGTFFMPTTKTCMEVLNLVGFCSTLEDIYSINGCTRSTIFEYGIGFVIQ